MLLAVRVPTKPPFGPLAEAHGVRERLRDAVADADPERVSPDMKSDLRLGESAPVLGLLPLLQNHLRGTLSIRLYRSVETCLTR
jgi:hypothetical protein